MNAILTYHSIDRTGSAISVSPEAFAQHVRWLAAGHVRVIPLTQLIEEARSRSVSGDAIALTFDDGFANFGNFAGPLLVDHALPATLFVVTNHVGLTNAWGGHDQKGIPTLPLLDWDALGRFAEAGVTIGGHTRNHPDLARVSPAEVDAEIGGCREDITTHLGRSPTVFAYPYGSAPAGAADGVREHFAGGVTTDFRVARGGDDAALMPRLDAYYFRGAEGLRGWGGPSFHAYLQMRSALRSVRARVRR